MKRIALFYGSSGGNTKKVAKMIANCFGNTKIYNIENASKNDLETHDFLIFGIPTWGIGNMQFDWEDFSKVLRKANLKSKTVALFGLGDQINYPDHFADALGLLYWLLADKADIIGRWPSAGYRFNKSKALQNGYFHGLVLDMDNEVDLTIPRIERWCHLLRLEIENRSQFIPAIAN